MVDMIDWEALADLPPKVVVGYSDVTALHQAIAAHLGVVTLHGPMMSTADLLDSAAAQEHLRATLFEPETVRVLAGPEAHRVIGGTASGVTVGGCASVLSTSIGTAGTITDNTGGIALLEDVNEPAYRLDSYLTHLRRAGWFDGVVGIVLGSWAGCEPAEPVVLDVLGDLGVPILGELGFGHGADPITVPLGVRAHLDADAGTLVVAEPALG
jgi:muramoyltetrapeptide carboxypeptidase